jgi:hypothetical protein
MDIDLTRHLLDLEQQLLEPEIRTTPEKLDRLLAEDFFEYGSSGKVFTKQDSVGSGNGLSVRKMTLTDFNINILAPNVTQTTYRIYDETRNLYTLRSSIWKFLDGRWQMFFHQGTITNP